VGLDQYLHAERYVSGYDFRTPEEQALYRSILSEIGLKEAADPNTPSMTVSVTVAYWRKANQIHKWFVDNAQDGNDDCGRYLVGREQLQELLELCQNVKAAKKMGEKPAQAVAEKYLSPQSGFFFGPTEIDEWYWQDIDETIEQIGRCLKHVPDNCDFYYQSSW
jgi:hypothetical protein